MSKPRPTRLRYLEGTKYPPLNIGSANPVALTASRHGVRWLGWNRAAGGAITLPKANGKNPEFRLFIPVNLTGNLTIRTFNGVDLIQGIGAVQASNFQAPSNANTVTLNGTTTGGALGTFLELNDMGNGVWLAELNATGSGTAATPFSAT